jgi:mitochondrial fission protein ELM1
MTASLPGECWAITDHAAGNQRQALALGRAVWACLCAISL